MGMLKKLLFSMGIILAMSSLSFSQGTLKGKVTEAEGKTPIPYVNVIIEQGGKMFGGAVSDDDGNYTIKPIPPGKYNLKASFMGYNNSLHNGILISGTGITFVNVQMTSDAIGLKEVIIPWVRPLISIDGGSSGNTLGAEEISKMPVRTAEGIASTMAGVQGTDGNMGSVRGQRADGTVTYINGIRVIGSNSVPASSIEEIRMITGGVPAKYGEAVGGVMDITLKGPSRSYAGGIELAGSLDGYNNFTAAFSLTGPLIKSKNKDDASSLLGFFIGGEFNSSKDGYPAQGGTWKLKDAVRENLEQNPIIYSAEAINFSKEFLYKDDLEKIHARENTGSYSGTANASIDVKTGKNTNLSFGGSFNFNRGKEWDRFNSLMNSERNQMTNNYTYSVYGKFSQRFRNDSAKLIKNVFYQLQLDYSKYYTESMDPIHKENFFDYGYIGKFKTYKAPSYERKSVTINGMNYEDVWVQSDIYDSLVTFERSEINPFLANYNNSGITFSNYNQIRLSKGLINGEQPDNLYGIYSAPGAVTSGYSKYQRTQLGFTANGSADFGKHAIEFGFEYQQLSNSGYSLGSTTTGYYVSGLWNLMRGLANSHIEQLDLNNPKQVFANDGFGNMVFVDTVNYERNNNREGHKFFDRNLRTKLGLSLTGNDWIDIDNLDPSTFSLDMFSAEELLNGNYPYVDYYGFDHTGKKISGQYSIDDFLNKIDANGNLSRNIGAYEPIYMAGYIQDKFAFEDLIFSIGFRIDRFDANQKVLKDNYLFAPARTVGEVSTIGGKQITHPSNIGSDYYVYVDDAANPSLIKGYRNGTTWYNDLGQVIQESNILNQGTTNGEVTPYLIEDPSVKLSVNAFKDYEPQFSIMPRINFSFPISDEALFYAHYDVITKRPNEGNLRLNPIDYLNIERAGTNNIANPNLKPEQKVDYEIGFKQALNKKSAMTISAYYAENRDQIQSFRFSDAFPNTYYSFHNIDFGTTQGFIIDYELRSTDNVRIGASYTLQFAKGTGSSTTSSKAIVSSGQPNLRTLSPLDFDQRHALKVTFDYRFGFGKDYNGPKTKKATKDGKVKVINWLENTGINFTFQGTSGSPYTRSSTVESINGIGTTQTSGSMNGSNYPWQFWVDTRIDKAFMITLREKKDSKKAKIASVNVYLSVLNLFNIKNVRRVYAYTGNADDDGFLTAAQYQQQISTFVNTQSFIDIYRASVAYPYNYSLPRRINLGVQISL